MQVDITKSSILLSSDDYQVLSHIFDLESAPAAGIIVDSNLPPDQHIHNLALLSQIRGRELETIKHVKHLSKKGSGDVTTKHTTFEDSFQVFSLLIEEYPQYASAYNNRAQVIRWRYGDRILIHDATSVTNDRSSKMLEIALSDLDVAIRLGTPRSPSEPVSPSQAKLLAQAYTQRGTLLYTASKELKGESEKQARALSNILSYKNFTTDMLEEASARDFSLGGRYGNEIGRAMAVRTNPYAKVCGNIVKEAMRKEFSPGLRPEVLGGKAERVECMAPCV
ncbi:hypothetical protein V8E51_015079 [Hyaloscypha variabilis]|jgi:hypothetical protein